VKTLSNGATIPYIGMGTWPIRGLEMERVMEEAMEVGYRLFDTPDNYSNEDAIGNVIQRHPSMRDELRIMTKISDEKFRVEDGVHWSSKGKYFYLKSSFMKTHTAQLTVRMLVDKSLMNLKTDYVDSLIIHWPYADYILDIWEEMVNLYHQGVAKSIGVSNFGVRHLDLLGRNFEVLPMINQISVTPIDTKEDTVEWCNQHGVQVICYAPMKAATHPLICKSSIVQELCNKYGVSINKLLLMWNLAQGFIPIPKTTHKDRMVDNLCQDVPMLSDADIKVLDTLNHNIQFLPESKYCPGL
jgi:diketogulonate reductase-like aldo/keto reductase